MRWRTRIFNYQNSAYSSASYYNKILHKREVCYLGSGERENWRYHAIKHPLNHIEDKLLSCASYLVFSIVEKLTKKKTKKAKYTDGNFCGQGKRTPNGRWAASANNQKPRRQVTSAAPTSSQGTRARRRSILLSIEASRPRSDRDTIYKASKAGFYLYASCILVDGFD